MNHRGLWLFCAISVTSIRLSRLHEASMNIRPKQTQINYMNYMFVCLSVCLNSKFAKFVFKSAKTPQNLRDRSSLKFGGFGPRRFIGICFASKKSCIRIFFFQNHIQHKNMYRNHLVHLILDTTFTDQNFLWIYYFGSITDRRLPTIVLNYDVVSEPGVCSALHFTIYTYTA